MVDQAVSALLLVPMEYTMKTIWGATLNYEEFKAKIKSVVKDWLSDDDEASFASFIRSVKHRRDEIVRRLVISTIEEDNSISGDSVAT